MANVVVANVSLLESFSSLMLPFFFLFFLQEPCLIAVLFFWLIHILRAVFCVCVCVPAGVGSCRWCRAGGKWLTNEDSWGVLFIIIIIIFFADQSGCINVYVSCCKSYDIERLYDCCVGRLMSGLACHFGRQCRLDLNIEFCIFSRLGIQLLFLFRFCWVCCVVCHSVSFYEFIMWLLCAIFGWNLQAIVTMLRSCLRQSGGRESFSVADSFFFFRFNTCTLVVWVCVQVLLYFRL